jgi:glycosyltransferase involved in cell wall biosynthesis
MKLVFVYSEWCGSMHGKFDIENLYSANKGLTGSESDFFNMARELSAWGNDVTIICDALEEVEKSRALAGARVLSIKKYPKNVAFEKDTVFLAWNDPRVLAHVPTENLRIYKHEINDFSYCPKEFENFADYWVFLSRKQLDHNLRLHPNVPREKCYIGWNSINLELSASGKKRDPNKIVYCSSPDRGLHNLLEIFPEIRRRNPQTTLHVFYEIERWISWVKTWPETNILRKRGELIEKLLENLGKNGKNGVYLRGFVSNETMAKELSTAAILAYPCEPVSFTEGFSISIIDAAAAGCIPIISDADALAELHGQSVVMIPGIPSLKKEEWIKTILDFIGSAEDMNEQEAARRPQIEWAKEIGKLHAARFSRQIMAQKWEKFIVAALLEKKIIRQFLGGPHLSMEEIFLPASSLLESKLARPCSQEGAPWGFPEPILRALPCPTPINAKFQNHQPGETPVKPTRIAMVYGKFCSQIHGPFQPKDLYEAQGLTGSESFFFNTVWGLSELGYQVDAFCDVVKPYRSPELAGAHVYPIDTKMGDDYDAYLTWNEPDLLRDLKTKDPRKVTICAQQLNDFNSYTKPDFEKVIDAFVFPSETHQNYMLGITQIQKEKTHVIPNSINLEFYEPAQGCHKRNPHSIVWASSPDRGLHVLLELFPKIRQKVPDAILKIFYRFEPWYQGVKDAVTPNGQRARYIKECIDRLGKYGENGVFLIGAISNREMAKEFLSSKVLAYTCEPFRFTEGFSVTIMDACAAGCIPIISDVDAIGEVYADAAEIIKGKPSKNKDQWIGKIVEMLTNDDKATKAQERARTFAQEFSRQRAAKSWDVLIKNPTTKER